MIPQSLASHGAVGIAGHSGWICFSPSEQRLCWPLPPGLGSVPLLSSALVKARSS